MSAWLMKVTLIGILVSMLFQSCSFERLYNLKQRNKVHAYEQVDFHDLMSRYMKKDLVADDFEGIYSVSLVVVKKGGLLTHEDKERVIERQENYQEVAIIRDYENPNREYVEVPLNKKYLPSYSIRGEFMKVPDANLLIYKHYESRGKSESYTFAFDQSKDILEGIRKDNNKMAEYTYTLTYVRLNPIVKKTARANETYQ